MEAGPKEIKKEYQKCDSNSCCLVILFSLLHASGEVVDANYIAGQI